VDAMIGFIIGLVIAAQIILIVEHIKRKKPYDWKKEGVFK